MALLNTEKIEVSKTVYCAIQYQILYHDKTRKDSGLIDWKMLLRKILDDIKELPGNRWHVRTLLCAIRYIIKTPKTINYINIPSEAGNILQKQYVFEGNIIFSMEIITRSAILKEWHYNYTNELKNRSCNVEWTIKGVSTLVKPVNKLGITSPPTTNWELFKQVQVVWKSKCHRFFNTRSIRSN